MDTLNNTAQVTSFSLKEEPKKRNYKKYAVGVLGIVCGFIIIFALAYFFEAYNKPSESIISPVGSKANTVPIEVRNVPNPITGELYPEDHIPPWISNRPLAVMINNHPDARPQSNLIKADIVYEVVAEGGITRFLAFYLTNTPEKIGPVRSTREYYLMLVKELGDAMIMHIGYSPQALVAIESWPVRSLARGGASFWRENPKNVAIEHTAYVNGVDLRKLGDDLGWEGTHTLTSWKFKDKNTLYSSAPDATNITVDFWYKGDFSAIWKYDASTNTYLRFMGYDSSDQPIPHVDALTGEQLKTKNLIVQLAQEISIPNDEKSRLDYQLIGSGKAMVFLDGKKIDATWSKSTRDERAKYYDLSGQEIEFNRGNFWVDIVPDRNIDQVVFN